MLGLGLAMAPVGGWVAVTGSFSVVAWLLGAAVLLWVAGFDVIYACQDADFDRQSGLHSIPARFGIGRALAAARWLHVGAVALLAAVGVAAGLHPVYWIGWTAIAALLVQEARAAGIRARGVHGLVYAAYGDGVHALYWHAWAEVRAGEEWIAVDPTFGQPVADATHVALGRGMRVDAVGLLGGVSVVSAEPMGAP